MDQIEGMMEQPKRYYNIDGVGELATGVMCLGFTFLQWKQIKSPAGAIWHQMYFFVIYMGCLLTALHYGPKAIKERITYRRTGFVEYRRGEMVRPALIGGVVAAATLGVILVAGRLHWDTAALAGLIGAYMAVIYARGFARTAPWKWAVAAAVGISSLLALVPIGSVNNLTGDPPRLAAFARFAVVEMRIMGAFGVLLALSGGISFWLYLRHTRPVAQGSEG